MAGMGDMQWRAWKTQLVPLLYDWMSNHNIMWPSQACRWGAELEDSPFRTRRRIFYSEQTNPELAAREPPKLLVAEAILPKPRVASTEMVSTWTDVGRCPFVTDVKAIVHPGEVNKIRELPTSPDVVVTHTDAPQLYVWNTSTQPHMAPDKTTKAWGNSTPDVTLTGHKADAQFPLATAATEPLVASGGTDKLVLLWDLRDASGSAALLATPPAAGADGAGGEQQQQQLAGPARTTKLAARHVLSGHGDTVEDVCFQPGSASQLVSVGDDRRVLFWDVRDAGTRPAAAVADAHGGEADVHCVDWSGQREHLVATGAADGSVLVWDRRKLPAATTGGSGSSTGADAASAGAVQRLIFHKEAVMRLEWNPHVPGILASGGEDHLVVLWSIDKGGSSSEGAAGDGPAAAAAAAAAGARGGGSKSAGGGAGGGKATPPEVLFKHVGHRGGKVVDFQWCPASSDPWALMSVSENAAREDEGEEDDDDEVARGGGTMQIWRISDLLWRPDKEVLKELEDHKDWLLHGRKPPAGVANSMQPQQQQQGDAGAPPDGQQQQQQQQPPAKQADGSGSAQPTAADTVSLQEPASSAQPADAPSDAAPPPPQQPDEQDAPRPPPPAAAAAGGEGGGGAVPSGSGGEAMEE